MKYDWEATKRRSPNCDPFYWCGICGEFNNPYNYRIEEDFKKQIKVNRCPKCLNKEDTLYEKTNKIVDDSKARQDIKRDSQE